MSGSRVIGLLVAVLVILLVVAGTVVALRLTDPGSEEMAEATPTPQESAPAQATPAVIVSPTPTTPPAPPPTATPLPEPEPTPLPDPTPAPALTAGVPCPSDISAAIAAANGAQAAFMRGELEAAQLTATWGEMAARAQTAAASLLAKETDAYSVVRITDVAPQVNTCTVLSVSAADEVVVETAEVWTYDATLSCAATEDEQASREVVRYPAQQYTFTGASGSRVMQDWVLGAVNIETPWQCA